MMKTHEPHTLPADVQAAIAQGEAAFNNQHRFEIANDGLRDMSADQKIQHLQDSIFNAWAQAAKEGPGQPPMVERFYAATRIISWLESTGTPFAVGIKSRMNKALHRLLNDKADRSHDHRKSRKKKITPEAVKMLLKKVRLLRELCDRLIKLPPYAE
jgi:hypothetical protein